MSSALFYDTFISDPIAVATTDTVPNGDRRMFSPLTATLIAGDESAVLVDPPLSIEQTAAVGDWIEASGKALQAIYVTHGHGDHWFGAGPLLERFPGARLHALPGTIAMMKVHGSPEFRASLWDKQFPGVIPPTTDVQATPPPGGHIDLEGHRLIPIPAGHTDTDDTTILHVPSLNLVVAGDVVYNNVHQYLREAHGNGIENWLAALDLVENLSPEYVVCGHKDKTKSDDPATIGQTRDYLLEAQRRLAATPTALEFFGSMVQAFPHRLNPGALWSSAVALASPQT